ncbi:MAG: hypothetical protein AABZ53_16685 [Planctomycetota bacterium]
MHLPAILPAARRFAVALALAGSACSHAQPPSEPAPQPPDTNTPKEPSKDPALTDTSLPDVAAGQRSRPAAQPVSPTLPVARPLTPPTADGKKPRAIVTMSAIPGLPSEASGLPARRFYPEGTFLDRRRGKLLKISTGDVVFIPQRDARGKGEQPMVVLPCQNLARLEATPDAFEQQTSMIMSGQIFVYFDRQYILPSAYSVDRSAAQIDPTPTPTPRAKPDPAAPAKAVPAPLAADPSVADLIKDLETKRGSAKAIELTPKALAQAKEQNTTRPANPGDAKPDAKPDAKGTSKPQEVQRPGVEETDEKRGVTPEGTVLFNRRARLVRTPGGQLAASFDGDANTPAPAAMVLLRCRMAQRLEELTLSRGEGLQVQISGRVMVYAGRNYVIPTLAQVVATTDVKPMQ